MCKRNFVVLATSKRRYRLFVDDIKDIHKIQHRKRPALPAFEAKTSDEIQIQEEISS